MQEWLDSETTRDPTDDVKGGSGEDWPKEVYSALYYYQKKALHWPTDMTLANHARLLRDSLIKYEYEQAYEKVKQCIGLPLARQH